MDELGEIVQEFLVESHENLDQLDRDLVALEQTPGSRALLSSIFRTIHTIKGTSGFLAFNRLERVTHVGESLLARLRDGAQVMTPESTDALLRMVDTVRNLLASIETTGADSGGDIEAVIDQVTQCIREGTSPDGAGSPAGSDASAAPARENSAESGDATAAGDASATGDAAAADGAAAAGDVAAHTPASHGAGSTPEARSAAPATAETAAPAAAGPAEPGGASAEPGGTVAKTGEAVAKAGGAAAKPAVEHAAKQGGSKSGGSKQRGAKRSAAQPGASQQTATQRTTKQATMKQHDPSQPEGPSAAGGLGASGGGQAPDTQLDATGPGSQDSTFEELFGLSSGRRSVADSSIRVDVDLLDGLMRLVGELVLTRNQLLRAITEVADAGMSRTAQRLNLITSELQESVMKTRMQAIEHLWAKLPRVVRDLSAACGKQVRLAMEGRETELDRSLLEAVKDPLTHLVRNAVDHGIEPPAVRIAAGKPAEGVLTLRAYHEGGHVIVEVADDGAGINHEVVARTAVQRGVITREQLSHMEPREIVALVFRPGFSTAKQVTKVSGRGVGMDVVKTNIERIGGAVDVESNVGKGTTWRLTIPLTLAIIQALTVETGDQRYVIPQVAVHELVYLDGQSGRVIEHAMGAPVYRLRGNLLPLVRLDRALGLTNAGGNDQDVYVAVLQAEGRRFGLVVDRVLNTEEVVVKPLTARFKDIGVYAGATIGGDGRVALILDVASLARRAHLNVGGGDRTDEELQAAVKSGNSTVDRLLIAGVGERRVAIPLDMVTRLEEFPLERIERSGNREVVQYREQILPVVRLSNLLGAYAEADNLDPMPVVVYTERGRSVALAVDNIVDIVEEELDVRRDFGDDGLLGSAVIQQRVTELLDVRRAILAADPMFDTEGSVFESSDFSPYADAAMVGAHE